MSERKACCTHNLGADSTIHFCPTCGTKLSETAEDPDRRPAQYMCAACYQSGGSQGYREIDYGDAIKFCPNCGGDVDGKLRDPKGFMSCCGGAW